MKIGKNKLKEIEVDSVAPLPISELLVDLVIEQIPSCFAPSLSRFRHFITLDIHDSDFY